jgi:amidase
MKEGPRDTVADPHGLSLLDACAQSALVRAGQLSATELVEAAIVRIERVDPLVSAISHRGYAGAYERAALISGDQPMAGVPCLLKDSLQYKGMPSRFGSRLYESAPPDSSQFALADRLDEAGLVQLGKTAVPEFSMLPTTESTAGGATRNPWNLEHSCGGSSGGSAVAVATGMVPLAHGGDGGGSIRIPASCCGVVGFKPSRGGNVRARQFHLLEDVLVSDGLLATSVRDVAWASRWLRPPGRSLPAKEGRLRIAVCQADMAGNLPHRDVADAILATAHLCENLGYDVVSFDLQPPGAGEAQPLFRKLWMCLALDGFNQLKASFGVARVEELAEPWLLGLAQRASGLTPNELAEAYAGLGRVEAAMRRFFEGYDLLLTPVVNSPPPPLGTLSPTRPYDDLAEDMFGHIGYTPLQNIAGLPSVSLPLAISPAGLPIGSMLTAATGCDETLLRACVEIAGASPWSGRLPPIHASISAVAGIP